MNTLTRCKPLLGTYVEVSITADMDNQALLEMSSAAFAEIEQIQQLMGFHDPDTELSQLNRKAHLKPCHVSPHMVKVIGRALELSELSGGVFDITIAPELIKQGLLPDLHQHVSGSWKNIQLEGDQVYFNRPLLIDLGGIAKGYAVKRCLTLLAKYGIKHALVSAGGDTGLLGDRQGRPWLVGIKHPRAEHKTAVHIPLAYEAISTSGDYERYFIEDNIRYHHIINPKTGDSSRKVISVSVIGKDPTYVDALSTTVFVKGLKDGLALIDSLAEFEAIIIDNQQRMHYSKGLQQ